MGGFDERSRQRISRAVRGYEDGLSIPTRRVRRPGHSPAVTGLELVRLLANVPAAKLFPPEESDGFYEAIRDGQAEGKSYEEIIPSLEATGVAQSGPAYLCEFDSDLQTFGYVEAVTVFNMHDRPFNVDDVGGVFGNEAGSLGAGFCNATKGPGGELWLVLPDRRLTASVATQTDSNTASIANLVQRVEALEDQINP